jgi:hypothetical protein
MLSNFDHSQGFDQISISGEGQTCAVTMDSELKCFDKIGYTETPDVEVA